MTMTYRISQHDVALIEKAHVDRGDNGGICVDDTLVLEGNERFVDVLGWRSINLINYAS
jgi:hypothetical protein